MRTLLLCLALCGPFALAWEPEADWLDCVQAYHVGQSFTSQGEYERFLHQHYLFEVAGGELHVLTRLRSCTALGFGAALELRRLSADELHEAFDDFAVAFPDHQLGFVYVYRPQGEHVPALALEWRSGRRVNSLFETVPVPGEERHDRTLHTVYELAGAFRGEARAVLEVLLGPASYGTYRRSFVFGLGGPPDVASLAGEPVTVLLRDNGGTLRRYPLDFSRFP